MVHHAQQEGGVAEPFVLLARLAEDDLLPFSGKVSCHSRPAGARTDYHNVGMHGFSQPGHDVLLVTLIVAWNVLRHETAKNMLAIPH